MAGADIEDDEPLVLSSHALAALAEFSSEKDARAKHFEDLRIAAEQAADDRDVVVPVSMAAFAEDWNESQFWYSDETAMLLAGQLLDGAGEDETIAVVSTPSVFVAMKNILAEYEAGRPKPKVFLLEHDKRFEVFPEFVFYDFQHPFKLPGELKGAVDRMICDPPFLSEDCQTKTALTARWMSRSPSARVIVSTGERMEDIVNRAYKAFGVKTTNWEPVHARGLSNEFQCYTNFECEHWAWRADA